jgi:hypothetical protein
MRRSHILAVTLLSAITLLPAFAQAQRPGGQGGGDPSQQDQQDEQRRRARNKEFDDNPAPLPGVTNAGACPYVKVLYDAARYIEFKDAKEASSSVAYSGEIEGITANCAYQGKDPITVNMVITFSLGRGPQATGAGKVYGYWVAVTTRNQDILAKEHFSLNSQFQPGESKVVVHDTVAGITIPRANEKVTGSNIEVLVGFDVTPQMAEFNRAGKRFRVDAGNATQAAASPPGAAAKP